MGCKRKRSYSTNPARIGEMLGWLTKNRKNWAYRRDVEITAGRTSSQAEFGYAIWQTTPEGYQESRLMYVTATGKTMQHVLALLVCAVSKRELGE